MASKKISALSAAGTLTGDEIVPINQGGETVRTTLSDVMGLADGGVSFLTKFGGFNTVVGNPGLIMTFDGSTLDDGDYYWLHAELNLVQDTGTPSITVIVGGTSAGTFTLPTLGCLLTFDSLTRKTASPGDTYQQILCRAHAVTGAFGAFATLTGNIRPISALTKPLATPLTIEVRNITGGVVVTAGVYGGFLAKLL